MFWSFLSHGQWHSLYFRLPTSNRKKAAALRSAAQSADGRSAYVFRFVLIEGFFSPAAKLCQGVPDKFKFEIILKKGR